MSDMWLTVQGVEYVMTLAPARAVPHAPTKG